MLKNTLYRYGDTDGRVPAHLHFGQELFEKMIQNKDLTALVNSETDETYTYGELANLTKNIAVSLVRIGVRKGDVVSVCSDKRFEVLPTVIGIVCAGATFSPTDLTYGSYPLLHRLKICQPKVMFCSKSAYQTHEETFKLAGCIQKYIIYEKDIEDLPQDNVIPFIKGFLKQTLLETFAPVPVNGWDDKVFIIFSSGTTGLPKGVPVTHLSFLLNSQSFVPDSYRGKRILNTREWYYTYGLLYTLSCVRAGATIVYSPTNQEREMLDAVQKYKIDIMQTAPSTIMELLKSSILDDYDLSSVEYLISSSTPVTGEVVDAVKNRLPNLKSIIQLYGMSEAGCVCCEVKSPEDSKPGSSGVPCLGFIIKVVDIDTREPLGANQRGEICIKGPSVMKEYLNQIQDSHDEEGFLKTGDVGYYDENGYFYIVNRIKELIKFNDISIAPAEFEAILLQHPAVREAGVVGASHPKHGEVPVAFIALQTGASVAEEELVKFVNSRVTFRMRLAGGVRFVDALPRGAGDKLDRTTLKRMLEIKD